MGVACVAPGPARFRAASQSRRGPEPEAVPGLLPGPLLVAAAVASPDIHRGSVRGARADHVQAESRFAADDGAVGVEGPLLVGAAITVPDVHPGACGPGVAGDIEALAAVDLQLTARQVVPLLVGGAAAVPDIEQGPVGRDLVGHVQAPVGADAAQQHAAARTAAVVAADPPAVLEAVKPGLV